MQMRRRLPFEVSQHRIAVPPQRPCQLLIPGMERFSPRAKFSVFILVRDCRVATDQRDTELPLGAWLHSLVPIAAPPSPPPLHPLVYTLHLEVFNVTSMKATWGTSTAISASKPHLEFSFGQPWDGFKPKHIQV